MSPVEARFWAKVNKTEACWLWTAATQRGYGAFGLNGRLVRAHRYAYELLVGTIPEGMVLDHIVCDNPLCVRPDHVRICTPGENTARSNITRAERAAERTQCRHGHDFTPKNTYTRPDGARICRACTARCQREYYQRRKAAH